MKKMKSTSGVIKIITGLILVLSIAAVSANNITYGFRMPYDRLLARNSVYKPSSWWGTHSEIITYPPKGHVSFANLTAITLIDHGGPKNFGYSQVLKGGPGHRNVTLLLKSQTRKPINITVDYYGR